MKLMGFNCLRTSYVFLSALSSIQFLANSQCPVPLRKEVLGQCSTMDLQLIVHMILSFLFPSDFKENTRRESAYLYAWPSSTMTYFSLLSSFANWPWKGRMLWCNMSGFVMIICALSLISALSSYTKQTTLLWEERLDSSLEILNRKSHSPICTVRFEVDWLMAQSAWSAIFAW